MIARLYFILFLVDATGAYAQRDAVVIRNDRVVKRYQPGDDFVYKKRNGRKVQGEFIIAITPDAIITNRDTVATNQVERLYFRRDNLLNVFGGFLVAIGGGIFVIDAANTLAVRGEEFSLDDHVTRITLTSLALGVPMLVVKKRSHRVGFRLRLRIIDHTSPFYYNG